MTGLRTVRTDNAPTPTGRYSQAIVVGDLCFLAGQAPFDREGGLVDGGLEAQVRQCFSDLEAVAAAAGTRITRAVRIGVFLDEGVDLDHYSRIYAEIVAHDPPPARTTVFSSFPRVRRRDRHDLPSPVTSACSRLVVVANGPVLARPPERTTVRHNHGDLAASALWHLAVDGRHVLLQIRGGVATGPRAAHAAGG